MGHRQDRLHVLLDDQHREPVAIERHERRVDQVDEARGQRGRRLVEEQEAGADDEGAGDGEQALLAPGQAPASCRRRSRKSGKRA